MITTSTINGVNVVAMEGDALNMIDVETVRDLHDGLARATDKPIVLTGSALVFSAGFDVVRILREPTAYTVELLEAFEGLVEALVRSEVPVVAAMQGHAIGAGFILAAACDARVAAGGRHGVPESRVGFPVPPGSLEVLRSLSPDHFRSLVYGGHLVPAERLTELGVSDAPATGEDVLTTATAAASAMAGGSLSTFTLHKWMINRRLVDAITEARARHGSAVAAHWTSHAARESASAYLDSLKAK